MKAYGSKLGLILLFAGAVALAQQPPRAAAAAAASAAGPGHGHGSVAWVWDAAMAPLRHSPAGDPWNAAWAAGGRIPRWWRSWA